MRAYLAFTKKEILESWRTYKLLIIVMVFLFLGMLGPLTAKITPQLLELLMTEGIQISVAEPTALDSWAQFFKNVSQMGFIIIAIIFSGMMANEYNKGTLINMLTKGLPRRIVILSKFTVATLIWTIGYLLCFGLSYAYTAYFWNTDGVLNLLMAVFFLWLFGLLFIATILLGGTIFKSSYGSLLFIAGFIGVLFTLNIIPGLKKFNPIALSQESMSLLMGSTDVRELVFPMVICIIMVIFFILIAIKIFNKKQI